MTRGRWSSFSQVPVSRPKQRVRERGEEEAEDDSPFAEHAKRAADVVVDATRQYQRNDAGILDGHSKGETLHGVN